MKFRWAARGGMLFAAAALLLTGIPAFAGQGGGLNSRRPPRNYVKELREIANTVAEQLQATILVDPALFVPAAPKAPKEKQDLEKALDQLIAQARNGAWKRVYVMQAQANALPSAEKLAASVRALDLLEQSGLVLEDPASRRATSFLKNYAIGDHFEEDLTTQGFSAKPVYVLYYTGTNPDANKSMQERFIDLQRQQLLMMSQMSPEQMAQAMQQGMDMWMSMDPQVRTGMMRAGMQMWMNTWQNMNPQQRQQMIQEAQQMFMGMMGGNRGR